LGLALQAIDYVAKPGLRQGLKSQMSRWLTALRQTLMELVVMINVGMPVMADQPLQVTAPAGQILDALVGMPRCFADPSASCTACAARCPKATEAKGRGGR
jgi:hypothetical protein